MFTNIAVTCVNRRYTNADEKVTSLAEVIIIILHLRFSLPSELIQEREEKFVSKSACCHKPLCQIGIIDFS